MSADASGAGEDYSTRDRASRPARRAAPSTVALRAGLALLTLAGAVCLIAASFSTVIQIKVLTTTATASGLDTELSGYDRHGPALILVAVFAVVMLAIGLRTLRLALLAVVVAGLVGLLIGVIGDAPHIHDTGEVGQVYADAAAGAQSGFYLETLGGMLVLLGGVGLLVTPAPAVRAGPRVARDETPSGGSLT